MRGDMLRRYPGGSTNDVRGTPVSCTDAHALEGYEAALLSYQNYVVDPHKPMSGLGGRLLARLGTA